MKIKFSKITTIFCVFIFLAALISQVSSSAAMGDASNAKVDNPVEAFAAPQTQDLAAEQAETAPEDLIVYTYDELGRLVQVEYPIGPPAYGTIITYTYDGVGNRVSMVVYPAWDVNMDTDISMWDVIQVGNHWLETGDPGWIREDVNDDGVIDMWDVIMIGNHWGE
jgi:hypothetical protein